jgi:hypothetical protein
MESLLFDISNIVYYTTNEFQSQVILKNMFPLPISDTVAERTCLIEKVYPDLHTYCRHFGFELQVYDLRWGLRDQSTDDHGLPTTCLKYLQKCQEAPCGGIVLVSSIG